jgi:hypothetical protein
MKAGYTYTADDTAFLYFAILPNLQMLQLAMEGVYTYGAEHTAFLYFA